MRNDSHETSIGNIDGIADASQSETSSWNNDAAVSISNRVKL